MNPEVKKLWVDVLRSGNYKQSKLHLRDNDGYCCLGVLCELAVQHKIIPSANRWDSVYAYDGDIYALPDSVTFWAGLPNSDPRVVICGTSEILSAHNDFGITFEQIADAIEGQL